MAERVVVTLYDDLEEVKRLARGDPPRPDDPTADDHLVFAIDGEVYSIDLSAANAKAFREAVRPFREAGQKATVDDITAEVRVTRRRERRKQAIKGGRFVDVREFNRRVDAWAATRPEWRAAVAKVEAGGWRSQRMVHAYVEAHPDDPRP